MKNESFTKTLTLSLDAWITERKPFNTSKEFQFDFGMAASTNSPLCLTAAHQKPERVDPDNTAANLPNRRFSNAISVNVRVKITLRKVMQVDIAENYFILSSTKMII